MTVSYAEEDKDAREACNVAKHDEESLSVAWTSVYQKIALAKKRYQKEKSWPAVTAWLLKHIGAGKLSKNQVVQLLALTMSS